MAAELLEGILGPANDRHENAAALVRLREHTAPRGRSLRVRGQATVAEGDHEPIDVTRVLATMALLNLPGEIAWGRDAAGFRLAAT
jgi:hypothetical protein